MPWLNNYPILIYPFFILFFYLFIGMITCVCIFQVLTLLAGHQLLFSHKQWSRPQLVRKAQQSLFSQSSAGFFNYVVNLEELEEKLWQKPFASKNVWTGPMSRFAMRKCIHWHKWDMSTSASNWQFEQFLLGLYIWTLFVMSLNILQATHVNKSEFRGCLRSRDVKRDHRLCRCSCCQKLTQTESAWRKSANLLWL